MENHLDVISANDFERQKAIPNESFDFVFANNFHENAEFIDRTLAIGGLAAIEMTQNPSFVFDKPLHYKIVYVRRFDSNIIAMRKLDNMTEANSATSRRLLSTLDEKKAALRNLEDVLLEPPRAASGRSRRYLNRPRYLPDLTGDTLESYPRRVFIDVVLPWHDKKATGTEWFLKNYPTRNLHFETYKIETMTEELSAAAREGVEATEEGGMSSWLRNNVKEEEYVVMKAEAEVVEEMLKSKAIRLVDELFLECRTKNKGQSNKEKGGSRAYWECLALYGRLTDEGVAVHQWWG
ncbi:uncharacterized protein LOC123229641 [Mangifera indica]|uniref:uncharacterized protein LOC123229641 n=1 Tax=Mangifera indica TaxID=29780 RepID=UPI001CFAEFFD|nr:uncharacterized protein LOC123229641 [Mangifera indica]